MKAHSFPGMVLHVGRNHYRKLFVAQIGGVPSWPCITLTNPKSDDIKAVVERFRDESKIGTWNVKSGSSHACVIGAKGLVSSLNYDSIEVGNIEKMSTIERKQVDFEAYLFGISVRVLGKHSAPKSLMRGAIFRRGMHNPYVNVITCSSAKVWNALNDTFLTEPKDRYVKITKSEASKLLGLPTVNAMSLEVHKFGISIRCTCPPGSTSL